MLNKCQFIGHLGKEPEIRSMQSGDQVASFSVAVTEKWKDKQSGERKERTEWVKVSVFNQNLVKVVENFLTKGSKVYVEGQMETRKWQNKDGVDQYSTEIVLKAFGGTIIMLDGKSDNEKSVSSIADTDIDAPKKGRAIDPMEDDIPFNRLGKIY